MKHFKNKIAGITLLTTALMLGACGGSSAKETSAASTEVSSENETTTQNEQGTSDVLDDIKMGASRQEVAEALGTDGLEVAALKNENAEIYVLQWISADSEGFIQATFEDGKVIGKNYINIENDSVEITLEAYNQLKEGMTYEEVNELLGAAGRVMAETDEFAVYGWMAKNGASISIMMENDQLQSLAQYNLN